MTFMKYKIVKIILLFLVLGSIVGLILKNIIRKNVYIEIGVNEITIKDFLYRWNNEKKASIISDLSNINLKKTGTYKIEVMYNNKKRTSTLHLVDTTPPIVVFQDIERYKDYKINPNDFIVKIDDLSEVLVESTNPVINDFGKYYVKVNVIDAFGNSSTKNCILNITWLKSTYDLELGTKISKKDLVYNSSDIDKIPDSEIEKINKQNVGSYNLKLVYNKVEYNSVINIKDTTAPILELKEVEIYEDENLPQMSDFISELSDASPNIELNYKQQPEKKIGKQEVTIVAKDIYNNISTKTTILSIIKDEEPPVFTGLHDITINKNQVINYESGVKANDKKDGEVTFSIDTSNVNTSVAGTYYAIYKAEDKAGNIQTQNRKITIRHDYHDTESQVKYHGSRCGSNYESIRKYVMNLVVYNANEWGGEDPVWQGLVYHRGNCKVYAETYKRLLEYNGYETQIIWTTDKTHYWNLVKINGVWRHSDASPGPTHGWISAVTDEVRYNNLQGRNWDRTLWPEAK